MTSSPPSPHDGIVTTKPADIGSQYTGYLYGDDTANLIDGKAGNDELSGGDGDDRVYGSGGNDRLFLGQGMDNAIGGCETKVAAP
jgi:Ca2+-binding RTX toxin-like protein